MTRSNILLVAFCLLSTRIPIGRTEGLIINTHEVQLIAGYADRTLIKATCNSLIIYSQIKSLTGIPTAADYECTFHLDYNPVCNPLEEFYTSNNFCDNNFKKPVVAKDKALQKQTVFDPLRQTQPTIAARPIHTYTPNVTEGTMSQKKLWLKEAVVGPVYTPWKCLMDKSNVCDGFSMCLTDECGCKDVDVFYCADSAGCISHANVCDGIEDCRDGSDECMCDDVIHCTFKDHAYCIPRREYCIYRTTTHRSCVTKHAVDCLTIDEKKNQNKVMLNDIYDCTGQFVPENNLHNLDIRYFREFCENNCHFKSSKLCQHLLRPSLENYMTLGFRCSSLDGTNDGNNPWARSRSVVGSRSVFIIRQDFQIVFQQFR